MLQVASNAIGAPVGIGRAGVVTYYTAIVYGQIQLGYHHLFKGSEVVQGHHPILEI